MTFDPRHPAGPGNEIRYSDDQPRDDHGRFAGGGASASAAEKADNVDAHEAAMKYHVKQARLHEAAAQTSKTDGEKIAHQQAADKHLDAATKHDVASTMHKSVTSPYAPPGSVDSAHAHSAFARNASIKANEADNISK